MEELKNENIVEQSTAEGESVAEEPVIEQRPSTKYGRTAYQQQLQAEQEEQAKQNGYTDWETYQQSQNSYQQQYTPYEEAKPQVKNWVAYVAMVLVALSTVITFAINVLLSRAYSMGETLDEVVDATLALSQEPNVLILSSISDLLFWATVAFLIFDIIQIQKTGKKIGGAIAFAILLRPAYFIWRAHLLGQKKIMPVIYAVVVYLISFAQYGVLLSSSMDMVMRIMY